MKEKWEKPMVVGLLGSADSEGGKDPGYVETIQPYSSVFPGLLS